MTAIAPAPLTTPHLVEPDAGLAGLLHEASAHPAVLHPLLGRAAEGTSCVQGAVLRRFAREYGGYSAWYSFCLRQVLSRVPGPHRAPWQRRLRQELGQFDDGDCQVLRRAGIAPRTVQGVPRAALFARIAEALGAGDGERDGVAVRSTGAAAAWRTRLLRLLTDASPATAIGAIALGTEFVARAIYRQLLAGVLAQGSLRCSAFVFLELQCLVNPRQAGLFAVVEELAATPAGIDGLREGMRAALQLRCEFHDRVYVGAMEPVFALAN
ncbi:MAG: hypothetical protein WAT39_21955 [Planctomycetota bacterium]